MRPQTQALDPGLPLQLLVICGPTASGKTGLGIALAQALETEIISADSMQLYEGMGIGTAAPSPEELALVPHHFVASIPPTARPDASTFSHKARKIVARLNAAGKIAVVVGGSGLYINALLDGLFDGPPRQPHIRARLHQEAAERGNAAMLARLESLDPAYAATLSSENDLVRIVRALEVCEVTGQPFSALHAAQESPALRGIQFALDWPRPLLYERINQRVDAMVAEGWIAETEALLARGYGPELERIKALGYRELAAALRGEQSLDDAIERTKMHHRRYAKRQISWFRGDKRVHWLPTTPDTRLDATVAHILAQLPSP